MSGVLDPGKGTQAGNALAGRVMEPATIHGLLAAAWRAESGALVLAGPPGIGKSTLVQNAIGSAPGCVKVLEDSATATFEADRSRARQSFWWVRLPSRGTTATRRRVAYRRRR